MICHYCNLGISLDVKNVEIIDCTWDDFERNEGIGYELKNGICPNCSGLIILLSEGRVHFYEDHPVMYEYRNGEIIYPKAKSLKVLPIEVEGVYRKDFMEAYQVIDISPKASAAISRRLLQCLLREEFKIKLGNLNNEIDAFIARNDIPTYIVDSVDAIRNVGNFAAHPMKSTSTGEVVDVENGEAEWLLDVLEALFDFALVQPKKLEEKRKKLNEKLTQLGKPLMK